MKRWALTAALSLVASTLPAQPLFNNLGDQKNVCKVWDGTDTANVTAAGALQCDGSGVTQPVSGTLTCNAGSGTLSVSGPLTDSQLRATPVPVSGTVTVTDGAGSLNTIVDSGTLTCNAGSGTFGADTELPAAAALGDNTANPTVPGAGVFLHAWDGSNWDRLQTGGASGGALKVDGSAVTQPVSGTVTVTDGAGALNVIVDSGTTAVTQATASNLNAEVQGEAADGAAVSGNPVLIAGQDGTNAQSIKTDSTGSVQVDIESAPTLTVSDGAGSLNVIIDSGTTTVTQSTAANLKAEVVGTKSNNGGAPGSTNVGTLPAVANAAAPTQTEGNQVALRAQLDGDLVVVMEDELPAGTQNIGDVDIASLPNEGEQTAANSISVTLSSDNDPIGATAAAVPGEAIQIAGTDGTNLTVPYIDPCQREARTVYRVDIVTATTTEVAAATSSEFYWICSINLVTAAANNVIIVEDDSATNCPSPTAGVSSGGTTSGEGWNFAANGGIVVGTGSNWIMKTGTANRSFCIITSAATQLSGTITYVSAP